MGTGENSTTVYIIDFGLAKKYRSSRTLQHIAFKNNKKLTGTARYASINALKGVGKKIRIYLEQSRRDDLEAIGYVLMYFLRGSLPWQGLKVDKKEDRYKKIYEKKKSTTPEELCKGYAKEFCEYVHYTRNLAFEQEPDYNYLRGLLKKVLQDNSFNPDLIEFDWEKKRPSVDTKTTKTTQINTTTGNTGVLNTENNVASTTPSPMNNVITNPSGSKSKHNSNNNIQLPNINQYKSGFANQNNTTKKSTSNFQSNELLPKKSMY